MKKCLSIFAVLMLGLCFIFSGCSPKLTLPSADEVYSNGGRVVMVDDYVYYANTFVNYSDLDGEDNIEKTVKHNSINRVKTNQYGYVERDEEEVIKDNEVVYSKMAGFNNSHMFVVGDYLYYTTPNAHKDERGEDLFDKTSLFRVKLDGTGNKELFSTKTSQGKFYLVTGEQNYLLVFDDSKIQKYVLGDSVSGPEILAEDVLDTVFPKEYGELNTVYYTKDISEQDKQANLDGNFLYKLDLNTKTSTLTGKPQSHKLTFVAYENNILYYKKLVDGEALYYSNTLEDGFEVSEKALTYIGEVDGKDSISMFNPINEENYVFVYGTKIFINKETTALVNEDAKIQMIVGDYVYYSTTKGLYRISYKDRVIQTVAEKENIVENSCEIAGEYAYFYAKLDENTSSDSYCFRADIRIVEDGRTRVECIAQVSPDDLSSKEE